MESGSGNIWIICANSMAATRILLCSLVTTGMDIQTREFHEGLNHKAPNIWKPTTNSTGWGWLCWSYANEPNQYMYWHRKVQFDPVSCMSRALYWQIPMSQWHDFRKDYAWGVFVSRNTSCHRRCLVMEVPCHRSALSRKCLVMEVSCHGSVLSRMGCLL